MLEFEFIIEYDSDDSEEINGIYNDDGTKIDLNTIPIPGLCVVCKNYQVDDWDENILCNLTRADQKNSDNFECHAFDPLHKTPRKPSEKKTQSPINAASMDNYLKQLIDDLHEATWKIKPPHDLWSTADPDDEVELEDMSFAEQYIYGKEEKISKITGIETFMLPPPEKLSEEQQGLLAEELEKLLSYFHFHLVFPDDYPSHFRYPFILNFWNEEHVALSFGNINIEFCTFDEENCPFPGYCKTCKEVAEQMKFDEEQEKRNKLLPPNDDSELPF